MWTATWNIMKEFMNKMEQNSLITSIDIRSLFK